MSLEKAFVLGCYYYEVSNPIWFIYRAKLSKMAAAIKLAAAMNETRISSSKAA